MKIKINVVDTTLNEIKADALVIPLFEGTVPAAYAELDRAVGGMMAAVIKSGDFKAKCGETMLLPVKGIAAPRIILAGLGPREKVSTELIRRAGSKAFGVLSGLKIATAAVSAAVLDSQPVSGKESPVFYFLEGGLLGIYSFETYKKKTVGSASRLSSINVLTDQSLDIKWLQAMVSAVYFARDMVNTPSNDMTPTAISKIAKGIKGRKVSVKVLEKREAEKQGMGAYISVSRGSDEPLKFIVIEYRGGKGRPVVLIGKSVTFDSGGLDIKPGDGMEKMKYDMAGGAAVLAAIRAAAEIGLPHNIIAILPAVENLIGGSASRPGDVVSTVSGKTVEIISTDAEGRMALADAMGYALRHLNPLEIIDIATLTGACNMAFGNDAIAMMGTGEAAIERLTAASEAVYERAWRMPLFEEYGDYLKSDIADIKNVGGRKAALCSSAYFLKGFSGDTPWVHLDIAGSAWNDTDRPYSPKGASGIGVRLLLQYLKSL